MSISNNTDRAERIEWNDKIRFLWIRNAPISYEISPKRSTPTRVSSRCATGRCFTQIFFRPDFYWGPLPLGGRGKGRVAENSHKLRSYVSFRTAAISAGCAPIYYSSLKIRATSTAGEKGNLFCFFPKTSFETINIYEQCKISIKRGCKSNFRVCSQEIILYAD